MSYPTSANIVIILFLLNASSGLMVASGFAEDIGINLSTSGESELLDARTAAQTMPVGSAIGSTLFGLIVEAAKTLKSIFTAVFIAPIMFTNLGVPGWIVTFVFAPMYIIVGLDIIQILTGRVGT